MFCSSHPHAFISRGNNNLPGSVVRFRCSSRFIRRTVHHEDHRMSSQEVMSPQRADDVLTSALLKAQLFDDGCVEHPG